MQSDTELKECTKCHRKLPLTSFHKEKRVASGLTARCKECIYKFQYEYAQTPKAKENKRKHAKKYGQSEKGKATISAYAATDKSKAIKRAFSLSERGKEIKRKHAHSEKGKATMKICQQRPHIKEARKEYKKSEQGKETNKRYQLSDKGKANHLRSAYKRRALSKVVPSTLTAEEWEQIKKQYKYCCVYCGEEKELTRDHVIPLTKGGTFTKENVVPACRSCNATKHTKTVLLQLLVEASSGT